MLTLKIRTLTSTMSATVVNFISANFFKFLMEHLLRVHGTPVKNHYSNHLISDLFKFVKHE